jgi:hypothetical protein
VVKARKINRRWSKLKPNFLLAEWLKSLIWLEKDRFGARARSHVIMT